MKKILFRYLPVLAVFMLAGCGDNSREAAKETAHAAGRLAVAAAGDVASTVVDVAIAGAKGTGEVIAEQASEAKDAIVQAAKAEARSIKESAKKTCDSVKKEVK